MEGQNRPHSDIVLDMDARTPNIPYGSISGVMIKSRYSLIESGTHYTADNRTLILADCSNSSITVTLPAASASSGKYFIIKKVDDSGNQVTISPDVSSETIDGEASVSLRLQYQYVMVCCDGSVWHIIGGEYVRMEDMLEDKLDKVIDSLMEILLENRQSKLHLASISQEDIGPEDVDE